MSLKENDAWLESAGENFNEAMENNNFSFARAILKNVELAGFVEAARDMRNTLKLRQSE